MAEPCSRCLPVWVTFPVAPNARFLRGRQSGSMIFDQVRQKSKFPKQALREQDAPEVDQDGDQDALCLRRPSCSGLMPELSMTDAPCRAARLPSEASASRQCSTSTPSDCRCRRSASALLILNGPSACTLISELHRPVESRLQLPASFQTRRSGVRGPCSKPESCCTASSRNNTEVCDDDGC
jgi:hypothetical protein